MTEGVTTAAAVPGAVHGPAGGRHGRRDERAELRASAERYCRLAERYGDLGISARY